MYLLPIIGGEHSPKIPDGRSSSNSNKSNERSDRWASIEPLGKGYPNSTRQRREPTFCYPHLLVSCSARQPGSSPVIVSRAGLPGGLPVEYLNNVRNTFTALKHQDARKKRALPIHEPPSNKNMPLKYICTDNTLAHYVTRSTSFKMPRPQDSFCQLLVCLETPIFCIFWH